MKKRKLSGILIIALIAVIAVICFRMSAKIDKLQRANDCLTNGLLCRKIASEKYPGKDFRNAKFIICEPNTELQKVIDTVRVSVIEDSENAYTFSIILDKPVSTKADWKIALANGNAIIISDIETDMIDHHTMFGEDLHCEVTNYKVNGKQNKGEFEFIE